MLYEIKGYDPETNEPWAEIVSARSESDAARKIADEQVIVSSVKAVPYPHPLTPGDWIVCGLCGVVVGVGYLVYINALDSETSFIVEGNLPATVGGVLGWLLFALLPTAASTMLYLRTRHIVALVLLLACVGEIGIALMSAIG